MEVKGNARVGMSGLSSTIYKANREIRVRNVYFHGNHVTWQRSARAVYSFSLARWFASDLLDTRSQDQRISSQRKKGKKSWSIHPLWGRSPMRKSKSSQHPSFHCVTWNTRITTAASSLLLFIFTTVLGRWTLASHQDSPESGKLIACLEQHLKDANDGGGAGYKNHNLRTWSYQFASYTCHNQFNAGDLYEEEITISQDAPS